MENTFHQDILESLYLKNNELAGTFPESLCSISFISVENNSLCPPYPSCIENILGNQDTVNCY